MQPLRILIADDHELVRRGLRALLDGYSEWQVCGEAVDGLDAIEKAQSLRPDILILDINMPNVNGLEAVRVVKNELPDSKIILVSQHDPRYMQPTALEAGATAYISKAALSNDLIAALEAVRERREPQTDADFLLAQQKTAPPGSVPAFLSGGGEMGALMRRMDWAKTPLGSVDSWSPTLRAMVRVLLANRFPLLLWWGPEFCSLYNDAYRPILGTKHPQSIGQPVSKCWQEIWHILKPLIETPFHGGPATWMEDIPLTINRHGFLEETHFTIAYSPVPDDTAPGGIGGVLATVHEITEKVVAERRVIVLRDLGARSVEPKTAEEACAIACEILAEHSKDVPFALLYLIEGNSARLAATAGVDQSSARCSQIIDLASDFTDDAWNLAKVLQTQRLHLCSELNRNFASTPQGPWPQSPKSAAVVPIRSNVAHQLAGFAIVGISPVLEFDQRYENFLELLATQVATMIANARGYEAERKRAEALAEIDRAKTTFFSNVSHEFRTPLTLMLGPLEDLLTKNLRTLPSDVKQQLESINRNGARLLRLVNTLLDFSRIEAGRVQAVYEPTDLASLTTELASAFRSATDRAGLQLLVKCSSLSEPAFVDRDMWEKIVLNLISNAFKFTFTGEIVVTLEQVGNCAELSVRDTGVGIPPEEMPRLFERFHRVQNTRSRTYEGSGIGLALVHELVKFHGGTLRAQSTVGSGSTFIITIPLGKDHLQPDRIQVTRTLPSTSVGAAPFVEEAMRWLPSATEQPDFEEAPATGHLAAVFALPSPTSRPARSPYVLVVDDNADMREYLLRLLAERYIVRAAPDGKAALDLMSERTPDLVLSDIMMPRLDGLGLLQHLRSNPETSSIPVILLSARAGEEARIDGLSAGADDYLIKPFSSRELLARVHTHLELARVRAEAQQVLKDAQANLELRVKSRTEELERAQHDLRQLSARLLQTQDEERRRIARELHDSAGQLVAALAMNLSAIGQNARRPNARMAEALADSRLLVQQLTQEIRTLSYLLHPPLLDEQGLNGALRWYAEGLTQRSGIAIELDLPRDIGRLPEDLELALFRIAQECLTNIHRHSGSKAAQIRLTREPARDFAEIRMQITDQGCGIPQEKIGTLQTHGSGVGLRGMLERVRHFGGRVNIDSSPNGTTVSVAFPLPATALLPLSPSPAASMAASN